MPLRSHAQAMTSAHLLDAAPTHRMHACAHAYAHVRARTCACKCACIHICMHVCMHTHMYACVHVCVHMRAPVHARSHSHTHARMHACSHARIRTWYIDARNADMHHRAPARPPTHPRSCAHTRSPARPPAACTHAHMHIDYRRSGCADVVLANGIGQADSDVRRCGVTVADVE